MMTGGYLAVAAKLLVNVHDMNNEMATGNVVDIRTMEFLVRDPDGTLQRVEAPAVSGRMIKHWHLEALRELALERGLPLCDGCRIGEPIRPGREEGGVLRQVAMPEDQAVEGCVICDVHGYLIAQGAKSDNKDSKDKRDPKRRNSKAMFSWALPVMGTEAFSRQVTHTRNSAVERIGGGDDDKAGQALFYKSYGSEEMGLVAVLNLGGIGADTTGNVVIGDPERQERWRAAIDAFRLIVTGRFGAAMSHALPHIDVEEVTLAYNGGTSLPVPTSPIYPDYLEKTAGMLPPGTRLGTFGVDGPGGVRHASLNDLFTWILQAIE